MFQSDDLVGLLGEQMSSVLDVTKPEFQHLLEAVSDYFRHLWLGFLIEMQ